MKFLPIFLLIPCLCLFSCTEQDEGKAEPEAPEVENEATPEEPPAEEGQKADEQSDDDFVGLVLEEAEALAKERKLVSRVVSVDGEGRPATADYRPDRVSFDIEKGKVTKVTRG